MVTKDHGIWEELEKPGNVWSEAEQPIRDPRNSPPALGKHSSERGLGLFSGLAGPMERSYGRADFRLTGGIQDARSSKSHTTRAVEAKHVSFHHINDPPV